MKPIRSNELLHLDTLIKSKFKDRRQTIESDIESTTQKQTDKNYKKFVDRLGIKAQIKAFKEADQKLVKFPFSKVDDLSEEEIEFEFDKILDGFSPIIQLVEDKFLEYKDEILRMKNVY